MLVRWRRNDDRINILLAKRSVSLGGFLGALLREEFPQDGGALLLANTGCDGAVVVEPLVLQKVHCAAGGSALGVRCAEYHPVKSAIHHCPGTHRTRLLGDE